MYLPVVSAVSADARLFPSSKLRRAGYLIVPMIISVLPLLVNDRCIRISLEIEHPVDGGLPAKAINGPDF